MKTADLVWIATALLHRERPVEQGFRGKEILDEVRVLDSEKNEATVNAHIYLHCVAQKRPNPAAHRMLFRNPDGTLRLYREGDECHPSRREGKITPELEALPPERRDLLDWYGREYAPAKALKPAEDPIGALRGVGKELWRELGGDKFIAGLRKDWFGPAEGSFHEPGARHPSFAEVWERIGRHAGDRFRTARDLPFTYVLHGDRAVKVNRQGRIVNRLLPRSDFERAWERGRVGGPKDLQDLQGPSYLYAILSDPRIVG